MKPGRQKKKNNPTQVIGLHKIPVWFLLVLLSGLLLSSHPGLMRDVRAANEKNKAYPAKAVPVKKEAGAPSAASDSEACLVNGIFYDEVKPRVLVNEELFSINNYCCGGKITGIFPDFIVLEFPYGKREYKLGHTIRMEKIKVEPTRPSPASDSARPAPKVGPSYVDKVNSLVESFMVSHNQHYAALDMQMKKSLFTDPNEASQIRVRASRVLELIKEKKQELAGISAPDNCKRHYALSIKLLDIAEDGWRAVFLGDKDKAEVFFGRLLKISQEISRESVSILARQ